MPKKISDSLFDRIQYFLESQNEPVEFELRHLWAEAEKLANADVSQASIVKAAVCVFRNKQDDVYYWNENALKNNASTTTLLNAAVNLRLLGQFGEAAKLAMRALEIAPQNPSVVLLGCEALALSGRLSDGIKAFESMNEITGEVQEDLQELQNRLRDLELAGVTEQQLQREIALANQVAMENGIRLSRVDTQTYQTHDDPIQVIVGMRFKGDIHREIELEEKLASKLSELEDWDPLKLNVEFRYLKPHELHQPGLTVVS